MIKLWGHFDLLYSKLFSEKAFTNTAKISRCNFQIRSKFF